MDMLAVAIYLVLRFCFNAYLDGLGAWVIYTFESFIVAATLIYYRRSLKEWLRVPRQLMWLPIVALLAGIFVAYGAVVIGLPVPFDVADSSGIFLLLVVAPVLEELLFRFFLWKPFEKRGKPAWAWSFTTLIFAYAHWHAVWSVPDEWQGFLAYQTLYTLGLGLACGAMIYLWRSMISAITIHFAFNLGFWLVIAFA